ncbi:DNA ligase 1-like [Impatiens glandulifera]|uniref:DNA ligase 1-like n=1 Tax=Impatiens glandulifera TaxID=253017 RepID=UPI001FB07B65|nr:DNA ligase 1-like [Impatiens glandulifera]
MEKSSMEKSLYSEVDFEQINNSIDDLFEGLTYWGKMIKDEDEDEDEEHIPKPTNKKRKAEDEDEDTTRKPSKKKRKLEYDVESTPKYSNRRKLSKSLTPPRSPPTVTSKPRSHAPIVGCKCDQLKRDIKEMKRDIMEIELKMKVDDEKENEDREMMNEKVDDEKENEDEKVDDEKENGDEEIKMKTEKVNNHEKENENLEDEEMKVKNEKVVEEKENEDKKNETLEYEKIEEKENEEKNEKENEEENEMVFIEYVRQKKKKKQEKEKEKEKEKEDDFKEFNTPPPKVTFGRNRRIKKSKINDSFFSTSGIRAKGLSLAWRLSLQKGHHTDGEFDTSHGLFGSVFGLDLELSASAQIEAFMGLDVTIEVEKPDGIEEKERSIMNRLSCGTIRLFLSREQKYVVKNGTSA